MINDEDAKEEREREQKSFSTYYSWMISIDDEFCGEEEEEKNSKNQIIDIIIHVSSSRCVYIMVVDDRMIFEKTLKSHQIHGWIVHRRNFEILRSQVAGSHNQNKIMFSLHIDGGKSYDKSWAYM